MANINNLETKQIEEIEDFHTNPEGKIAVYHAPMGEKPIHTRKKWFECVKSVMRIAIKPTEFDYLGGEKINGASIVLCNHVGTSAPLAWELYSNLPFRFWGASEMNMGLGSLYKYQTRVYYHGKKHWNLFLARLFCIIASPLTYMFYRGLNLISTYQDMRFRTTITQSLETLGAGKSVIIFPEVSDKGYLDVLEGFHEGFTVLAGICQKKNIDVPIYTAYYKKSEKRMIVDAPIMLSELFNGEKTRKEIADALCARCNELGQNY